MKDSVAGVDGGVTQGGFKGTVDVSRINPCELTVKFTSSNEQGMDELKNVVLLIN